jgi:hypothetical protein
MPRRAEQESAPGSGTGPLPASGGGPPEFASAEEFARTVDESWRAIGLPHFSPVRTHRRLSDAEPAGLPAAAASETAAAPRRRRRTRQVGIKLSEDEYALLVQVAKRHAVALGTLARILTVKGARLLDQEEQQQRQHDEAES